MYKVEFPEDVPGASKVKFTEAELFGFFPELKLLAKNFTATINCIELECTRGKIKVEKIA